MNQLAEGSALDIFRNMELKHQRPLVAPGLNTSTRSVSPPLKARSLTASHKLKTALPLPGIE
jgi:hypothetical protein